MCCVFWNRIATPDGLQSEFTPVPQKSIPFSSKIMWHADVPWEHEFAQCWKCSSASEWSSIGRCGWGRFPTEGPWRWVLDPAGLRAFEARDLREVFCLRRRKCVFRRSVAVGGMVLNNPQKHSVKVVISCLFIFGAILHILWKLRGMFACRSDFPKLKLEG